MDPVLDFMAMTDCGSEDIAIHYLSMHDFDVTQAVTQYNSETAAERRATTSPQASADAIVDVDDAARTAALHEGSTPDHHHDGTRSVEQMVTDLFEPVPSALLSRNPFEHSENATLREMYTTPSYVHQTAVSLPTICRTAAEKDRWVLLALRDGNFSSVALPRDVWRLETMAALQPSLECYEADLRTTEGRQLAQGMRADVRQLPAFFLFDPVTSCCEKVIPVRVGPLGELDGAAVVNEILQFIAAHDSPHVYLAHRQQAPSSTTGAVDEDDDVKDDATAVPPHGEGLTAASAEPCDGTTPDATQPSVLHDTPAVTLEEWCADAQTTQPYKLRCRLPRGTLELSLKPDTPLSALRAFFADHIARDEPARYPSPPTVMLQSGFPPRAVTAAPTPSPTLAECTNLHSGDLLIVSVAK